MIVTAKSILALLMSISSPDFNYSHLNEDQAYCMAINIYHEARSENVEGQFAVAHATLERVKDPRYPNTVCGVVLHAKTKNGAPILHKCAFSWNCDGLSDRIKFYHKGKLNPVVLKAFTDAATISLMAINKDIDNFCQNANFYYNPTLANPVWAKYYIETCVIGDHTFLRRDIGNLK